MKSLFISYKRSDGDEIARFFEQRLRGAGVDVFRDQEGLQFGRFDQQLERQISRRDVLLVLVTPDALNSEWIEKEVRLAIDSNKPIIAFRCWQEQLPTYLELYEAPLIARQVDRIVWAKPLHKTMAFIEQSEASVREHVPRVLNFSMREPFDQTHIDGVLILNGVDADAIKDLGDPKMIEAEVRRLATIYSKYSEQFGPEMTIGLIPPSLGVVAMCLAACLAGQNQFPPIFWPHQKTNPWTISRDCYVDGWQLRREFMRIEN